MTPDTLRTFIAVPMPEAVTAFLQNAQKRVQAQGLNLRWVAPENIHLTLKFFGDVALAQIPAIIERMDAVANVVSPFGLVARGVGAFPNCRHVRVLWVGLSGDIVRLRRLQEILDDGLFIDGFGKASRDFRAHLTIGRTRQKIHGPTIAAALARLQEDVSDSFRVERLSLIKSVLKPTGAAYTRLHTSHLAG